MGKKSKDSRKNQDKTSNGENNTLGINLQAKRWEEYFSEARVLYQMGVAGDTAAARQALELFEQLCKQVPGNSLLEAYYGSAYILKAREESNLVNKGKISSQGLKILDGALGKDPDNIEIRIVHAFVCKNLPDWLNRGPSAIEDFQYLQSRYEADPAAFSEQFYLQIQPNIEEVQQKLAAIPPHVQKIYDGFSKMAKKKQME